jgi:hypothetical protein
LDELGSLNIARSKRAFAGSSSTRRTLMGTALICSTRLVTSLCQTEIVDLLGTIMALGILCRDPAL